MIQGRDQTLGARLRKAARSLVETWEIYLLLVLSVISIFEDYAHVTAGISAADSLRFFQGTLTYVILMLSLLSVYLVRRDVSRLVSPDTTPRFQHAPLEEALRLSRNSVSYIKHVRILASTTANIEPLLMMNTDLTIEKCDVLVSQTSGIASTHSNRVTTFVQAWIDCMQRKRIHELTVKGYDFIPLMYVVIFDSSSMVLGLLIEDPKLHVRMDVGEPIVISNETTEGKILIAKWTKWFDSLRDRLPIHHDFRID